MIAFFTPFDKENAPETSVSFCHNSSLARLPTLSISQSLNPPIPLLRIRIGKEEGRGAGDIRRLASLDIELT